MSVVYVLETCFHCCTSNNVYGVNVYRVVRSARLSRGGGVIIYIRSNFQFQLVDRSSRDKNNTSNTGLFFVEDSYCLARFTDPSSELYDQLYASSFAARDQIYSFLRLSHIFE